MFADSNSSLKENAPLPFAFLKTLMKMYNITNVAFQKLMEQKMHCDSHALNATTEDDEEECHVLVVEGEHGFGVVHCTLVLFQPWMSGSQRGRGMDVLR